MARTRIADIETRPPEAGRIRFGHKVEGTNKAGKKYTRPAALETWRLTSPERSQIEAVAKLYGGDVEAWNDPKASPQKQWQVTTTTDRIQVWLPPGALTLTYELWSGGGCERRCDGEWCMAQRERVPCLCAQEIDQDAACKPKCRLNVLLPGVPFSGVWRLETSSENFLHEAPGILGVIGELQSRDTLAKVELILSKRTHTYLEDGKSMTDHFTVPQIVMSQTPEEIMGGLAAPTAGALGAGGRPALALDAGWTTPTPVDEVWHQPVDDDEIVEGELIEEPALPGLEGWDIPPAGVAVTRNPDPDGPKWIRRPQ